MFQGRRSRPAGESKSWALWDTNPHLAGVLRRERQVVRATRAHHTIWRNGIPAAPTTPRAHRPSSTFAPISDYTLRIAMRHAGCCYLCMYLYFFQLARVFGDCCSAHEHSFEYQLIVSRMCVFLTRALVLALVRKHFWNRPGMCEWVVYVDELCIGLTNIYSTLAVELQI